MTIIQPPLFSEMLGETATDAVVNVASVAQLSPFRYPGGKTWLVPRIRQWLAPAIRRQYHLIPPHVQEFVEPFAGGGIIGLTVAAERLATHVTMVELDDAVAAVWQTILDPDGNAWLAEKILRFDLTAEHVQTLLTQPPEHPFERAWQTIIRNRTNHGGILAPGSGKMKAGENGKGIASRWYPATLAKRIKQIALLRDRITFIHGDGMHVIEALSAQENTAFFLDPPYTVKGAGKRAGKRLYTCSDIHHERLFSLACQVQGDVLMTYDNAAEVKHLAQGHGMQIREIAMKNTHHAKMTELLIGAHLHWLP